MKRPIQAGALCLCAVALLSAQGCRSDRDELRPDSDYTGNREPAGTSDSIHSNGTVTGSGLGTTSGNNANPSGVIGGVPNSRAGGGDASVRSGIGTEDARDDRGIGAGVMPNDALHKR